MVLKVASEAVEPPPAAGVAQVGALAPLEVSTWPAVPAAVAA